MARRIKHNDLQATSNKQQATSSPQLKSIVRNRKVIL